MKKQFLKTLVFSFFSVLLLLSQSAFACGDCEYESCFLGACICLPTPSCLNPSHSYCVITNVQGESKSRCTNCSSTLSGDAGAADCLARNLGNYTQYGACIPSGCLTVD